MAGIPNTAENFLNLYEKKSIRELQLLRITLDAERNRKNIFINFSIGIFAVIVSIYALATQDIHKIYLGCWSIIAAGIILFAYIRILKGSLTNLGV